MMIQAVLGNPHHPEYGVATIPFPIPHDQYAHCMELLEALEIGDAVKADCKVEEIDSFYSIEDEYMELISADEGAALVRLLGQGLSSHLTETQRRRLWKYCVEGKPVRLIAKEECAYRNAVWKSIQTAKEKMFKFFVETGCAKPRFRRDR